MKQLTGISSGDLPVAQPLDLIVLKAAACPVRGVPAKSKKDTRDVFELIKTFPSNVHLRLLWQRQLEVLQDAAEALQTYYPQGSWKAKLPQ